MRGRIFFLFFGLWMGCKEEFAPTPPEILSLLQSGVEITDTIKIIYSDSARTKVIIHAPLMYQKEEKRRLTQIFPQGIFVQFFDDMEEVESTLRANEAIRNESNKTVTVSGNVIFKNQAGDILETPTLVWNEIKHEITTDKPYKITRADGTISRGFGFVADENFTQFRSRSVFNQTPYIQSKSDREE